MKLGIGKYRLVTSMQLASSFRSLIGKDFVEVNIETQRGFSSGRTTIPPSATMSLAKFLNFSTITILVTELTSILMNDNAISTFPR